MEIVGVIITQNRFLVENREVTTLFQQPDLGLRWDFAPRVSRPDKTNLPPGQISPFHPPGLIMTCRVVLYIRLVAKPGCWEIGFRQISRNIWI